VQDWPKELFGLIVAQSYQWIHFNVPAHPSFSLLEPIKHLLLLSLEVYLALLFIFGLERGCIVLVQVASFDEIPHLTRLS
jgi:hypothetical protein